MTARKAAAGSVPGGLRKSVASDRPYSTARVGAGVAYVIATSLVEDTLFTGFPTFKFCIVRNPALRPVARDSTNGGSGGQRYSDPSTWGGDGDQLPAVQAYNLLRGIRFNGAWLYGLQNMTGPARLPPASWVTHRSASAAPLITGAYPGWNRPIASGGQVNVDVQPATAIESLLTACQGRLSEIGGFYKIHPGRAGSGRSFAWTDADLLSSEQQTFRPFFALSLTASTAFKAPIRIRRRAGKPPPRRRYIEATSRCATATAA